MICQTESTLDIRVRFRAKGGYILGFQTARYTSPIRSNACLRVGPNFRNGKSLGRLHLRFKYDFDRSDLHVHLIEAHDLAGSDQGGFNDPYVKLTLSPEVDSRKRQTQIYRNETNPFFDQQFKFPVSNDELHDRTLVLQAINTNITTTVYQLDSLRFSCPFNSFKIPSQKDH